VAAHVPVRTCVACRARAPKGDLLRMVRRAGGPVVDVNGAGRGAYVHPDAACIAAMSATMLARAFRGGVSEADVGRLGEDLRSGLGAG